MLLCVLSMFCMKTVEIVLCSLAALIVSLYILGHLSACLQIGQYVCVILAYRSVCVCVIEKIIKDDFLCW